MCSLLLLPSRILKPMHLPTHSFDKYPLDATGCAMYNGNTIQSTKAPYGTVALNDVLEFYRHDRRMRGVVSGGQRQGCIRQGTQDFGEAF